MYCAKLLPNSIGAAHFNVITALAAPKHAAELSYEELTTLLSAHLDPKRNILVNIQHNNGQFPKLLQRAQFIRGIKDDFIREQLLQSDASKFEDIVDKTVALETCRRDSKTFGQPTGIAASLTSDINQVAKSTHRNENVHQSKLKEAIYSKATQENPSNSRIDYTNLGIDGLCLRCGRNNHLSKEYRSNKQHLKLSSCNKHERVGKDEYPALLGGTWIRNLNIYINKCFFKRQPAQTQRLYNDRML